MDYTEVTFKLEPFEIEYIEILSALLDNLGFDGITETQTQVTSYVLSNNFFEEKIEEVADKLIKLGCKTDYFSKPVKEQNWNETWESNFEPVVIGKRCLIKAPFHHVNEKYEYEIVIEPKMSFGTGHHATTSLVIEEILNHDLTGLDVLDMGCGTGVLAILCALKGAKNIYAIDIDDWAFENSKENIERNNVENTTIIKGGKESIPNVEFDMVIANINKNILLDQLNAYAVALRKKGVLFISGILVSDQEAMHNEAIKNGFELIASRTLLNWLIMIFEKK